MDNVHVIEKTVFDLTFADDEDAFEAQKELGPFVKNGVMQAVNEVFDEFSSTGKVIKIENLEIDLDEIEFEALQEQMEARLKERLRSVLREKIESLGGSFERGEGVITVEQSDFDQVRFFLDKGRLPWNDGILKGRSIEQLLQDVLRSNGKMFVDLLKESPARERMIKRLASQFPGQIPAGIARILFPAHVTFFKEIVSLLMEVCRKGEFPSTSREELACLIREAAVDELLKLEGAFPGEKAMSARTMKNLSRRTGVAFPLTGDMPEKMDLRGKRDKGEGYFKKRRGSYMDFIRLRIEEALISGSAAGIKEIWPEIVRDNKALFLEELRRYGVRVAVRRKVAEGFGDALLKEIVYLIEPVDGGFICDVVDKRELFHMALGKPPEEESRLRGRFWEFTLGYLLVERGSRFNKRAYMRSMVRQMAAHGNMKYADLVFSLLDAFKKSPGVGRMRDEMLELLGELAEDNDIVGTLAGRGNKGGEEKGADANRSEFLRWRIEEALITGSAEGIKDIWTEIAGDNKRLFLEELRRYGVRAAVRRKVADGFEEAMLKEIVYLIEPAEGGFICHMADMRHVFRQAAGRPYLDEGGLKRHFWEFTLAYLLVDRGSRFNKIAYMGSMVRQMAAHININYEDLVASLKELSERGGGDNKEMLQLLDGLKADAAVEKSEKEGESQPSAELLRSYELTEELRRCIAGHRAGVDFDKILDELSQKFPWRILEIFREMQTGRLNFSKAASRLSAEELGRFVGALISLAGGGTGSPDLVAAIQNYAKKAGDLKKYYTSILENIVTDKVIDFEEIIAAAHTHGNKNEKDEEASSVNSKDVDDPSFLPLSEVEGETFLERITAGVAASGRETARFVLWVERMMAERPERFKYLMEELLENKKILERIIALLPSRLMARLLFLLRGERYCSLLRCADIVAAACINMEKDPGRIERMKWLFIFSYIYKEGRNLDEAQFLLSFSKYLSEEIGRKDEDTFRVALAGQLALDVLPSTAETHLRMMGSLTKEDSSLEKSARKATSVELEDVQEATGELSEEEEFTEEVYIANAGQVLAAPYLPRLFDMLGLMDAGKFKDRQAAERAVHLLQFMVNGSESTPEYRLVLNKVLCGVKTGVPICKEIKASAVEKEAIEGLLKGMVQNWTALGKTSVDGFRQSFLQREGVLRLKDGEWHLLVEAKPFDMLLDRLPWSYNLIKHPWMKRVVHVEWR